ncbi:MAG: hypothetical protein KDJ38_00555 [Gammaproteobacteria bacterium]|nr:hypothetical protein [Gammaproteobacteria bacterium]
MPVEDKVDAIDGKVDRLVSQSDREKTIMFDQPLGERRHGIEVNLFRVLMWDGDDVSFSGTYSYFDTERNTEWAFPFFYQQSSETDEYWDYSEKDSYTSRSVALDMHYRRYLGHRLDGFYMSGVARVVRVSGLEDDDSDEGQTISSELKGGVGVGIGWRKISRNRLYWGMSLSLGRYFLGESEKFVEPDNNSGALLDDLEYFVDVEFFKFGYTF